MAKGQQPKKQYESVTDLLFVEQNGYPITVGEVLETPEEDEIIAVSSDDRLVRIVDAMRLRVGSGYGCGGTTVSAVFVIEAIRQLPEGSFSLIQRLPETIMAEKNRRIEAKLAWKRWFNSVQGVGYWLANDMDDEDITEALNIGLEQYLAHYR
ncbi:hypothetical protein [Shewanella colwelliana]|uniref:hypothetical protein n=1 Tax=Shewanella TaxID=22 RepID=UPI0022AEFD3E|nr:hypothetical protein [Shewanella colwelliana]MCZ4337617.1 hypothetical protein [Shewanella colwelliana]